ncbi:hypothetical protein C2S53_015363 [Perilla frutescens var. hirtella]|uniref:Bifunctional inhibitor/plant lipid transfer protein/seed storage helical domain-containing protein n=1 Tax=Perilla frutescens var. hirtella TaxID=608512 RepID=A0AAD4JPM9_PERFH|nr:hypothetical protein C2S53_015363 [Perilla frutescens var. hirtella]
MMLLLIALGATTVKVAKAIDCDTVYSTIKSCSGYLSDPSPDLLPGSYCCNAARKLPDLGDVHSLCQCLSSSFSGFLASKAKTIPGYCAAPRFSPLIPCIAKSSDVVPDSFLPPVTLPPIFPFPPVFTLPPFIPLPPVIPAPPVA